MLAWILTEPPANKLSPIIGRGGKSKVNTGTSPFQVFIVAEAVKPLLPNDTFPWFAVKIISPKASPFFAPNLIWIFISHPNTLNVVTK